MKNVSIFQRIKTGLARTRQHLTTQFAQFFQDKQRISPDFWSDLEDILIQADLGVNYTLELIQHLKKCFKQGELADEKSIRREIRKVFLQDLPKNIQPWPPEEKSVFIILGVNGVGKTTTIGKLAYAATKEGKKVLLAAGDTFRAAAAEQLAIWAERVGAGIIAHQEGADPAAVAYDAINAAKARKIDVVFIDTAGRLPTKINLMEELKKIHRVAVRESENYILKNWLILDATTGQNALMQVKAFHEAISLDGLIMTKLDGTAKGGIALTIAHKYNLPLLFAGVGEGVDDICPVDPHSFVSAIIGEEAEP